MAAESQEQDKSQAATPYKLSEARKRGQVAKSLELNNAFVLVACVIVLYMSGDALLERLTRAFRFFFSQAYQVTVDMSLATTIEGIVVHELMGLLWPLLAAALTFSILINIIQSGPVFSFFPLKPDITRLNPVSGIKRIFSRRTWVEFIKIFAKLTVIASVLFTLYAHFEGSLFQLSATDIRGVFGFSSAMSLRVLVVLTIALCVLALFDFVYTRWDFAQRMRMSNREVKEEHKRREGDPRIKAKIRQLQKERVKRAASLARVPEADVVITNPTHYAVALRFDRDRMAVPHIWAKGSGDAAMKIRQVAANRGVPILRNPRLARKLFWSTEIDQPINEVDYTAVARVLVWAYAQKKQIAYRREKETIKP